MPTKHHPTPEERDQRISVPLKPDQFIEGALAVEPDKDDGDEPTDADPAPDEPPLRFVPGFPGHRADDLVGVGH